jgi:hypothetical protein
MNNLALCESLTLREDSIKGLSQDKALETLDKAKALIMTVHCGNAIATTEQIAEYFELSIETISSLVKSHRKEFESDGLHVIQGKDLLEHKSKLHLCSNDARLTIWTPRAALRCGMLLRDSEVAKQVRTVLLDIAQNKESINNLEVQFLPTLTTKEIKEGYLLYKMAYGKAYADRWLNQKMVKYQPALAGESPKPEESASLPTAKVLLTPTQIAEQLGFVCKSNAKSFDARRVNKLLSDLGYQTKIDGIWSAADKAIGLNLCDRKPVDTGSHTQKDQLFWSVDVVAILQEYTAEPLALKLS